MKRAYQETAEEGRADVSRNVSAKLSIDPISINDIKSPEAKAAFEKRLVDAALHRDEEIENQSSPLHDAKPWIEATLKTIEECPFLTRVVDQNGFSLLYFCCQAVGGLPEEEKGYAVDTLKVLIEKNPHALVWNIEEEKDPLTLISKRFSVILPWITRRYPWVFEQPAYENNSTSKNYPLYSVIDMCLKRTDDDNNNQAEHDDCHFSPSLLKDLFDQCPQLMSSDVSGARVPAFLGVVFYMSKYHPHPELLEFMIHKRPDLALTKYNGNSIFTLVLLLYLGHCKQAQAATSNTNDDLGSCQLKILKLMLNLCPRAALVSSTNGGSRGILPIEALLSHFAKHGGRLALIELIAHMARIMYPNFEESAPANAKDNALMKRVLKILDKEKEAAVMSIRLKRSILIFTKGTYSNREAKDLYGCWVTNQLIQLKDLIKQYQEKDIPALKDWKGHQDDDDSDEGEDQVEEAEDDDDLSEDGDAREDEE